MNLRFVSNQLLIAQPLSTSSSPGSQYPNVDDRMFLTITEDLDHGSDS